MSTDVVIVNYNAGDLLTDCVQSVLAEGACHVFVVDNDSRDDSLAHLSASISDGNPPAKAVRSEVEFSH